MMPLFCLFDILIYIFEKGIKACSKKSLKTEQRRGKGGKN